MVFGLLLPVIIQIVGMLVIANVESRAGAVEFAALGVFFMLLFSLPVVLVLNSLIAFLDTETRMSCFLRGMIIPTIVFIAAIIYQSGLWDRLT